MYWQVRSKLHLQTHEASAPTPNLGSGYSLSATAGSVKPLKGTRSAYDPDAARMTGWPVYDRYALPPGRSVTGPALIEERESTCVIGTGETATVDDHYNLVAELGTAPRGERHER